MSPPPLPPPRRGPNVTLLVVIGVVLLIVVAGVLVLAARSSDGPDNASPPSPTASVSGDEAMCREAVTLLGKLQAGEGQAQQLGKVAATLDARHPGSPATEALTGYLRRLADAVDEGEVTEGGLTELRRLRDEFRESTGSQSCDALADALPTDSGRPAPGAS